MFLAKNAITSKPFDFEILEFRFIGIVTFAELFFRNNHEQFSKNRKNMKLIFTILIGLLCSSMLYAQSSDNSLPQWINNLPKPKNKTYFYIVAKGENETKMKDNLEDQIIAKFGENYVDIAIIKVCDDIALYTSGKKTYYGLFQVQEDARINLKFRRYKCDQPVYKSGFRPFIPGLAQYKKEQYGKMSLIIISEVAFIATGIAANNLKKAAEEDLSAATNFNDIRDLQNKTDIYKWVSIGSFTAAGIVYLFNVVDGFKPAKPTGNNSKVSLIPCYDPNYNSFGLSLCLNF